MQITLELKTRLKIKTQKCYLTVLSHRNHKGNTMEYYSFNISSLVSSQKVLKRDFSEVCFITECKVRTLTSNGLPHSTPGARRLSPRQAPSLYTED